MAVQKVEEGKIIKLTCDICKKEIKIPKNSIPIFRAVENNFKDTHARTCSENEPQIQNKIGDTICQRKSIR